MNTWGYHKSNTNIGDAPLIFGASVLLGTTIKEGMALNAAIGVGVNIDVQLSGNDPFSYVDVIIVGITAAATTGKSWQAFALMNMGGAAIGSGIKGEDPTHPVIGAGFGSTAGSVGGKVVDALSPVTDQVMKDVIGAVTGSAASELTGNAIKSELDKRDKMQNFRKVDIVWLVFLLSYCSFLLFTILFICQFGASAFIYFNEGQFS